MANTMIGNLVPMPDGSYAEFVEAPKVTFEDVSANAGMCIMVHGVCVGKTTGNYEADLQTKTQAESSYPNDGNDYYYDEATSAWVTK